MSSTQAKAQFMTARKDLKQKRADRALGGTNIAPYLLMKPAPSREQNEQGPREEKRKKRVSTRCRNERMDSALTVPV